MLYLKRGKTLTYGTHESLTYGIGKTLTPFEVVSGAENRMNFEGICLSLKKVDSLNLKQWVVTFFKGKSI